MKRIDLTQFYGITGMLFTETSAPELFQALKEAYDEIDKLQKALSIINSTHYRKE